MGNEPIPLHPLRMIIDGCELQDLGLQKTENGEVWVTTAKCLACGFEARSEVDPELPRELGANPAAFRASEDRAFIAMFIEQHREQRPDCPLG